MSGLRALGGMLSAALFLLAGLGPTPVFAQSDAPAAQAIWEVFCPVLREIASAFDFCGPAGGERFPEKLRGLGFEFTETKRENDLFRKDEYCLGEARLSEGVPAMVLTYTIFGAGTGLITQFDLSVIPVSPETSDSLRGLAEKTPLKDFSLFLRADPCCGSRYVSYKNARGDRTVTFISNLQANSFTVLYANTEMNRAILQRATGEQ